MQQMAGTVSSNTANKPANQVHQLLQETTDEAGLTVLDLHMQPSQAQRGAARTSVASVEQTRLLIYVPRKVQTT
ncbi:hypothetical protein GH733_006873 [Mirounga leonina]|nr:hypothetical protein GH733_006873 [Mirounga leonina]